MTVTAPMGRRERRKQEVRGRITEAAIELFAEKGCEQTTVEEICALADVARKTFYNYFPSKQCLVRDLSDALLFTETRDLIDLALEKHPDTASRLTFFCRQIASNVARFERLERTLIQQALLDVSSEDSRSGSQLQGLNEAFTMLFEAGSRQGDIVPGFSVEFLAEMAVGAINAIMLNWVHQEPSSYPVMERVEELTRWLRRMATTEAPAA